MPEHRLIELEIRVHLVDFGLNLDVVEDLFGNVFAKLLHDPKLSGPHLTESGDCPKPLLVVSENQINGLKKVLAVIAGIK